MNNRNGIKTVTLASLAHRGKPYFSFLFRLCGRVEDFELCLLVFGGLGVAVLKAYIADTRSSSKVELRAPHVEQNQTLSMPGNWSNPKHVW